MSTQGVIEQRILQVYTATVRGYSRLKIIQLLTKAKEGDEWYWGLRSPEQALDDYLAETKRRLAKVSEVKQAEELGLALERREDLYQRASDYNDIKTALEVDKDRAKLLDLYPVVKTHVVTEEHNPYNQIDVVTLSNTLAELKVKLNRKADVFSEQELAVSTEQVETSR